jgi:ABC-2 type transport system permease protein
VARREFAAAVKTKTFLISLIIMPVLMGSSIVVQILLQGVQDTSPQDYAVIDRTGGAMLRVIKKMVAAHNSEAKTKGRPPFVLKDTFTDTGASEVEALRLTLSERVRKGQLFGFLEIGKDVAKAPPPDPKSTEKKDDDLVIRYQTNRPTQQEFSQKAAREITMDLNRQRLERAGLEDPNVEKLVYDIDVERLGLSRPGVPDDRGDAGKINFLATLFVPAAMMMLMCMVVMMVANPLLQGVIEEKMQRIAEVLLGSVPPFELMLGKLLGMTAVSLTISAVYLAGGFWAAYRYGFLEYMPASLVVWFLIYQSLAGLLYGSLFIAIGAACTDMKEAQNLLMPVMLLVCMPLFVLGSVIREPNNAVVTWLSFFPFATPMLMIARQSAPPGMPLWQPLLGIVGVLAMTLFCVWAAGRIFRVGLLMQGKGARLAEMVQWVFKG